MNYSFIIDNRKCIGCHACSTACKSENQVPLGVYRTWVKYVETGRYPDTRRHFQVTRCNHCANPPCVRICPVTAMYQRHDGIVDFDPSICIGCKACMQACPYDAIYIDPDSGTAAKCHYCAHRTEIGLEPACVVVCPERAIIAGDMDDPNSEIAYLLASQDVTVRKPEQGTAPKLFYIDGSDVALHPTAAERTPESFMWAEVLPLHGSNGTVGQAEAVEPELTAGQGGRRTRSGVNIRTPQSQGTPKAGPIFIGATMAEQMVQVAYNAQHKIPWHWPVPAYLVTKGVAAGIFIIMSLGLGFGWFAYDDLTVLATGFVSLLFLAITTGLLVLDLEKPGRFFSILTRPQWRSWLARGAFILIGFTTVAGIWWLLEAAAYMDLISPSAADSARPVALWLGLPLAVAVAVYTAYLLAQAEGRDLWQSPLTPIHLVIQALFAGSGTLLILGLLPWERPENLDSTAWIIFVGALILDLFVLLIGEFSIPHASEVAAAAAHDIKQGRYRNTFWWGAVVLGHLVPLILALVYLALSEPMALGAAAGLAALAGLYLYEYAFVMAPQDIPNS